MVSGTGDPAAQRGSGMKIDINTVVTLHFDIHDADGNEIHSTQADAPVLYLHGWGELLDGLEATLAGKAKGDDFEVTLEPADAYGDPDPELVRVFDKSDFGGTEMRTGMELQGKDPEGNFRLLRVTEVAGDKVTIDMNHPLAGHTLIFKGRVEDVRAATEEEIAHGHVHLEGDGHHH
jgi:FKBP-type peptidyl-prolyl cis-trans isomerase SlyD